VPPNQYIRELSSGRAGAVSFSFFLGRPPAGLPGILFVWCFSAEEVPRSLSFLTGDPLLRRASPSPDRYFDGFPRILRCGIRNFFLYSVQSPVCISVLSDASPPLLRTGKSYLCSRFLTSFSLSPSGISSFIRRPPIRTPLEGA